MIPLPATPTRVALVSGLVLLVLLVLLALLVFALAIASAHLGSTLMLHSHPSIATTGGPLLP